ncbi:Zn-dependent hydrolase [Natrialbaceae archaeon A-CW1-1]
MTAVSINQDRLWESLTELGAIGEQDDGSMMRVSGSDEDKKARDMVVKWFENEGLNVKIDPVGNIIARRDGNNDQPPVVTGSHIDTVPNGGKFDGTAGVLSALEVVRSWNDANVQTDHPIDVVVFTEEEGTRFGTGMVGSRVASEIISIEDALQLEDDTGKTLEAVLTEIGYYGEDEFTLDNSKAFIELHVEQGPELEVSGKTVGVIENVTGLAHYGVRYTGNANHAGTTSMSTRQDAFAGVAETAIRLEQKTRELASETNAVSTIGKVDVSPNGTNVIPGEVEFTLDIRDTDESARQILIDYTISVMEKITSKRELKFEYTNWVDAEATQMDEEVVEMIAGSCEQLDIEYTRMASGAGHDAMNVANVTPSAMLFVPSKDGISHNPKEYTSPENLASGAQVLEQSLRKLASADA